MLLLLSTYSGSTSGFVVIPVTVVGIVGVRYCRILKYKTLIQPSFTAIEEPNCVVQCMRRFSLEKTNALFSLGKVFNDK